jgi:hypothetical protein
VKVVTVAVSVLVSALASVSAIVPFFQPPSVQTPVPLSKRDPLSIPLEITNESFVPIFWVTYMCEATKTQSLSGDFELDGFRFQYKNRTRSILYPKNRMTANCNWLGADMPMRKAEYRLVLEYYGLPWPFKRESEYSFIGIFDETGVLLRWTPK